jgi:hypothetical protein
MDDGDADDSCERLLLGLLRGVFTAAVSDGGLFAASGRLGFLSFFWSILVTSRRGYACL